MSHHPHGLTLLLLSLVIVAATSQCSRRRVHPGTEPFFQDADQTAYNDLLKWATRAGYTDGIDAATPEDVLKERLRRDFLMGGDIVFSPETAHLSDKPSKPVQLLLNHVPYWAAMGTRGPTTFIDPAYAIRRATPLHPGARWDAIVQGVLHNAFDVPQRAFTTTITRKAAYQASFIMRFRRTQALAWAREAAAAEGEGVTIQGTGGAGQILLQVRVRGANDVFVRVDGRANFYLTRGHNPNPLGAPLPSTISQVSGDDYYIYIVCNIADRGTLGGALARLAIMEDGAGGRGNIARRPVSDIEAAMNFNTVHRKNTWTIAKLKPGANALFVPGVISVWDLPLFGGLSRFARAASEAASEAVLRPPESTHAEWTYANMNAGEHKVPGHLDFLFNADPADQGMAAGRLSHDELYQGLHTADSIEMAAQITSRGANS